MSGDSKVDSAFRELSEVLAEIALNTADSKVASEPEGSRPNTGTPSSRSEPVEESHRKAASFED